MTGVYDFGPLDDAPRKSAPLCKDCIHFRAVDAETPQRCAVETTDLVTGEGSVQLYLYCYEMRRFDGACGPDGKLYEAKDKA